MDEDARKYLDGKFESIHSRISEMRDEFAATSKQIAVEMTKMDGKVSGHEKDIASLHNKAWAGIAGFMSALLMALWQLLTMKFGKN